MRHLKSSAMEEEPLLESSLAPLLGPTLEPDLGTLMKTQHTSMCHIEELPNDLWIDMMSYLSYEDLKQLRMVSSRCRELVDRRFFQTRGKVIVTNDNLLRVKEHVELGVCHLNFEFVELQNLSNSPELEQLLHAIGSQIKSIKLHQSPVFENMNEKLPNLRRLNMDLIFDKTTTYINLKQFPHLIGFECGGVNVRSSVNLSMLQQLRRVENKVCLRHFQFQYLSDNGTALLEVLFDHAPTLECVDIYFSCLPGVETDSWCMVFERMTKLRILRLSGNCHVELLANILLSIPNTGQLKQLILPGMLSMTNELLVTVAKKWRHSLQSLDLMFCANLDVRCAEALRNLCGSLQCLRFSFCRALTGKALIDGLATAMNYMLQELYLEDDCLIDEDSMCKLLERFPNLRKLSVENCREATTDRTLATIFQHQTVLRDLNVNYCCNITDKAFLGYGSQPYPISRLRRLKRLRMSGCRNVTDGLLTNALVLPGLLSISLSSCNRIGEEGVRGLTRNCPGLEALSMASCTLLNDEVVELITFKLKRLRYLNLSNCPMLTSKSFKSIAENAHNLRDLVMCNIEDATMVDGKAQEILSKHLPGLRQIDLL